MAFEEYQDDRADFTVSLGGTNKKTGKANPTSVEGYYLGSKRVPDEKKKCGYEWIHRFLTQKGSVDLWGKTDMNKKMKNARLGVCVKVEATLETKATKNGDMKIFKVSGDKDNVIKVENPVIDTFDGEPASNYADNSSEQSETAFGSDEPVEESGFGEEAQAEESFAPPPRKPSTQAKPNAARATGLLGTRK